MVPASARLRALAEENAVRIGGRPLGELVVRVRRKQTMHILKVGIKDGRKQRRRPRQRALGKPLNRSGELALHGPGWPPNGIGRRH